MLNPTLSTIDRGAPTGASTRGTRPGSGATRASATRAASIALAICVLLLQAGCLYTRYTTNTSRSATEQLLISDSIRKAVAALRIPDVSGRDLVVEVSAIPGNDSAYLKTALEARLGNAGARIVAADRAEFKLVAMVGGIGTVSRGGAFGVPSLPIPSLGATPEIPFISASRQRAWTQAQLFTWDTKGVLVQQSEPVIQRSRFDITSILFIEIRRNDVYPNENGAIAIE